MSAGSINRLLDTALMRPFRLSAPDILGKTAGREVALQVTRGLPDNPIDNLLKQFNDWATAAQAAAAAQEQKA